ncbi:SgcJ/EcaC family oxidoreductase [Promicromonospora sp. Populi]|uniref:SgcJ/EcaC family oxidoreductase n=1 Tax=Promicromonospora sp. Populi TaxID=3239420 RepID=UPI0034E23BC1
MKKLSAVVAGAAIAAIAFGAPAVATATPWNASTTSTVQASTVQSHTVPTEAQISALFDRWNTLVEAGDPEALADIYAPDAVLLPTLSAEVRTDRAGIVDYFEEFLARNPSGERTLSVINVLTPTTAIDTGLYTFTFTADDGTVTYADARYTFVYEKHGSEWLIVNHHSSLLPAS